MLTSKAWGMFNQPCSDPCIYTLSERETSIIGVYVDDFVIATTTTVKINEIKSALSQKFDVKDLGELHYFLGVLVNQNHEKGSLDWPTNFH